MSDGVDRVRKIFVSAAIFFLFNARQVHRLICVAVRFGTVTKVQISLFVLQKAVRTCLISFIRIVDMNVVSLITNGVCTFAASLWRGLLSISSNQPLVISLT